MNGQRTTPKRIPSHSTVNLNKAGSRLEVVYRPLAELKLDPTNPRVHSHKQIGQLRRSIESFGFNVPVLVDAKLKVIAGHGRVMACQLLGWSEVPTIRIMMIPVS
jgi:hypothetical protein